MIKKILAIVLIALQLLSTTAFAQSAVNIAGCNGYTIVFGNGIMNTASQMQKSRLRLKAIFGNTYNGQEVTYEIAENPSHGLLLDLISVIEQKITEDASIGWEIAFKVWFGSTVGLIPLTVFNVLQSWFKKFIGEVVPQKMAELHQKYEQQYDEQQYDFVDAQVSAHVAMFKHMIKTDKRKVLLVAHSQGNLYANASYKGVYLDPQIKTKSFALVGGASPANFVGGSGPYMTSGNDLVISVLRSLVNSDTLPANIDIPLSFDDIQGHGFLPVYTNETYAGLAKLQEMGMMQLNLLEDPDQEEDDLDNYRWFYATDYRSVPSGAPPDNTGNVTSVAGCFDNYTQDCIDAFNERKNYLKEAMVSIYPQALCSKYCNSAVDAVLNPGGGKSILRPGNRLPSIQSASPYGGFPAAPKTRWTALCCRARSIRPIPPMSDSRKRMPRSSIWSGTNIPPMSPGTLSTMRRMSGLLIRKETCSRAPRVVNCYHLEVQRVHVHPFLPKSGPYLTI